MLACLALTAWERPFPRRAVGPSASLRAQLVGPASSTQRAAAAYFLPFFVVTFFADFFVAAFTDFFATAFTAFFAIFFFGDGVFGAAAFFPFFTGDLAGEDLAGDGLFTGLFFGDAFFDFGRGVAFFFVPLAER